MRLCTGATLIAAVVFAESAERPKFEVASVKLSAEQRLMSVRSLPGGRLAANAPVKLLILYAYGFQFSEVAGGPDWINSDRYEIDAKAEGNANRARLMLMLQSLLEDRFQLKTHRESRKIQAYALIVNKKGSKLKPTKESACPAAETAPAGRPAAMPPPCGQIRISNSVSGVRMEGDRVPIAELVRVLAAALIPQPVLDRTGLSGTFDIRLQFIEETPGTPTPDSQGPTLFEALQDQLGLRLTSAKGPVEFLLIDHIERPSAN